MKLIITFTLLAVCTAMQTRTVEWEQFKLAYNKRYNNNDEELQRFQTFSNNLEKIAHHNSLYDVGLVTYKLGLNKFADMTEAEFQAYLSLAAKGPSLGANAPIFKFSSVFEIPESIDYRDKKAVNPIKDQAACGSCWAFSATGCLESINFLKTGKLLSLSEQNLVDCSGKYGNHGCSGGLMDSAYEYIKDNGLESETEYAYTARDGTCKYNSSSVVIKINSYAKIAPNEKDLEAAVATIGPIAAGVDASGWQFYSSGIYSTKSFYRLNHGIVVIGYGVAGDQSYWLIRNSWGTGWGEDGYIRLAKDRNNQVGISNDTTYPIL